MAVAAKVDVMVERTMIIASRAGRQWEKLFFRDIKMVMIFLHKDASGLSWIKPELPARIAAATDTATPEDGPAAHALTSPLAELSGLRTVTVSAGEGVVTERLG